MTFRMTDLSSILSQSTRLTDGQMDGKTDRILIARPRLHSVQRGKKGTFVSIMSRATVLYIQDAQLSQRDRAAGCVIVFAKSRRLELGDSILRTFYVYL